MAVSIRLAASLVATLLLFGVSAAQAANCTPAQKTHANRALKLTQSEIDASLADNLPWGEPVSGIHAEDEQVLVQRNYVIVYDHVLRVPIWTAHVIRSKALGKTPRLDCFRADPRLTANESSAPADYKEPIFDQGHMTPNGDMSLSTDAVANSFIMTNMTPQYCHFNRGIWQMFETAVRYWAKQHDALYVVTGSVFDADGDHVRDSDDDDARMKSSNGQKRVAIPTAIYKILAYKNNAGGISTLAVELPNTDKAVSTAQALAYLKAHVVSLKELSDVTGLSFFPKNNSPVDEATAEIFWHEGAGLRRLDSRCLKTHQ